MTTLLLYPDSHDEPTNWTNPDNLHGPSDDLCALTPLESHERLNLRTFKDADGNLPSISGTIDHVYVGVRCTTLLPPVLRNGTRVLMVGVAGSAGREGGSCTAAVCGCTHSSAVFLETSADGLGLDVDDINNENYYVQTWIQDNFPFTAGQKGIFEYVRVRVEYTPPAVAAVFGDGMVWITSALRRMLPYISSLLPLGGVLKGR